MIDNLDNIQTWIQENPERNRKRLCEHFKNDNKFAYEFGKEYFEYRDFVKRFIHESKWAYNWGFTIGDQYFMKHRITKSRDAYYWTRNIGDREFMKHKIAESSWAYEWAQNIGDVKFMKQIVEGMGNEYWIDKWNDEFKKNQISIF